MGGVIPTPGPLENPNLVTGQTNDPNANAIFGRNDATGKSTEPGVHGAGVFGLTVSPGAAGVFGANNSAKGVGVQGSGPEAGLSGFSNSGSGLRANSNQGSAILAASDTGHGLDVFSNKDIAIFAQGGTFSGVFNGALVVNKAPTLNPEPNNPATPIDGSIVINDGNLFVNKGDVILGNADCTEDFGISEAREMEPGTVMILNGEEELCESSTPYDRRVAGVISGAGTYKPRIGSGQATRTGRSRAACPDGQGILQSGREVRTS